MTPIQRSRIEPSTTRRPRTLRLLSAMQLPQAQPGFWALYCCSLAVDLGLCLYFFLFPLFLVEHRFSEHSIGFIASALTAGTLTGTIVVGLLARRIGLRPLLLLYVILAPLCLAARTQFLAVPAQLGLSFLAGAAMSIWFVSLPPTLASLTSENSRGFAFALFTATGIGSGALAGVIGGYLPGIVQPFALGGTQDGIRIVLLLACLCVTLAVIGVVRLRAPADLSTMRGARVLSGFLVRFLIAVAVWNFAISFFTPFANVYMSRRMGLATGSIGAIYSASQVLQVAAVLAAPVLYRRTGLAAGIAITQLGTALAIWSLARADGTAHAIGFYLLLTALQWMSGPGISTLLMNCTPAENRSYASAMHTVVNLGSQTAAAAIAGRAFEQFGYSSPLVLDGVVAALAGLLLYALLGAARKGVHCTA